MDEDHGSCSGDVRALDLRGLVLRDRGRLGLGGHCVSPPDPGGHLRRANATCALRSSAAGAGRRSARPTSRASRSPASTASDEPVCRLGRVGARDPVAGDRHGHEVTGDPGRVLAERDLEDPRHAGDPVGGEGVVADEVAQRVRDQPAAVPLHPAEHVRPAADDEVGARVDHCVREGDRVAAVLAEEPLRAALDVLVVGALAARVHRHDDEVGPLVGLADERLRGRDPEQALRPGIGREADDGDLGAADVDVRDLAGPAGREQPGLSQRCDRVRLAARAVVQRVVVREVHQGEPGVAEIGRVRGRRVEGEAVRARRAALGRAAVGERALEVAEHDVPGEVERDVAEVRLARGRRPSRCRR